MIREDSRQTAAMDSGEQTEICAAGRMSRHEEGLMGSTAEQANRRAEGLMGSTAEQANRRAEDQTQSVADLTSGCAEDQTESAADLTNRCAGDQMESAADLMSRCAGDRMESVADLMSRCAGDRMESVADLMSRCAGDRMESVADRMTGCAERDAENRRSEERRRRKQDQAVAARKKNKKKRKKEGRKLTPEEIERKKKLQAEKLARRKARREKAARIFKIVLKILLILVVLCAIAFVYIRTCYKLKSIKVTGTDHYTDQQMVDIVTGGKDYGNTLLFILESRLNPAQDVTFIDKIDVTYVNRNSVEITVYEKAMAGCIKYNDQYAYFDGDGIVLEISDAKLDDVPCIEGLTSDSVEQGKKLDVGDSGFFQEILTMTQLIYKSGIQIDKITYDTDQNLILHKDGIKIRIGDGENLETKFMNLESILESVKGKKGTLDMSNYSESQRNVIFKENK